MERKFDTLINLINNGSSVVVSNKIYSTEYEEGKLVNKERSEELIVFQVNPQYKAITFLRRGQIVYIMYWELEEYCGCLKYRENFDFYYEQIEDWAIETGVFEESMEIIRNLDVSISETHEFYKVGLDNWREHPAEVASYTDGVLVIHPLYFCPNLEISPTIKNNLTTKLLELGEKLNDWHIDGPVLDIIDPDLAPNYYFNPEGKTERDKYSWFPVDVLVDETSGVSYQGPIHNLPIHGNELLYECIFEVFSKMMPAFANIGIANYSEKSLIQVVVKAQKYLIQPGTSYVGKWHLEGKTEDIVAAGVYYCKIDKGFEEDIVVFTPKIAKGDKNYVFIKEGSAIVFANILPHRFLKLTNNTDQPLERLFINYFIVNPDKRLESTAFYSETFSILKKYTKLPAILIDEILSFLVYRTSLPEAKEKRQRARESMKVTTGEWKYVYYGNSGELEFLRPKSPTDGNILSKPIGPNSPLGNSTPWFDDD
jgi:hypothetical protein